MAHRAHEIYNLVQSGERVSDANLELGLAFYKNLADSLRQCGPVFKLAANEANRVFDVLDGYHRARNSR